MLLVAPSNPYVSIWPILAVKGDPQSARGATGPCVAVSPLIGGRAVKGPATGCWRAWPEARRRAHVAARYAGLIDALVVDEADARRPRRARWRPPIVTRTLMTDPEGPETACRSRTRSGPPHEGRRARRNRRVRLGSRRCGSWRPGMDVTIGSRDSDRATATAAEIGSAGATNADAVAGGRSRRALRGGLGCALDSGTSWRDAIGKTPVLSVASQIRFENRAALPGEDPLSLAERAQQTPSRPGRRGAPFARSPGARGRQGGGRCARVRRR